MNQVTSSIRSSVKEYANFLNQRYVVVALSRCYLSIVFFVLVTGCGGGSSSSDSAGLASGQDPDPVVVDFPVAYIKSALLTDVNGNLLTSDVRQAVEFRPGAELLMRDRASPSAAERSLTTGVFPDDVDGNPPLYDVKDLNASFDGTKLVFAMRAPEDPNLDDDEQGTWNIWMYDNVAATLVRVIASDITAEAGQDVAPKFLPDGRIVFSSTRQRQAKAVLLDEGKPQYAAQDENRADDALALHVVSDDGTDLHQISFNQSSDLDPAVLSDGRVLFSRWDAMGNRDRISFYTMNPDGSDLRMHYGIHSHDTGPNGETVEFVEGSELPDGRTLALMRPDTAQALMGVLPIAIDTAAYVEHDQPTFVNAGLLADAQEILIAGGLSLDETMPVTVGRYAQIYPLADGTDRLMVAWSQCRLLDTTSDPLDPFISACTAANLADPNFVEADPLYGIWVHDFAQNTQQPIVTGEESFAYSDVVVLEPRTLPPVILDKTPGLDIDADLVSESVGILHIRSVYDFDGTATQNLAALSDPAQTLAAARPARFLRIFKSVSMPDDDTLDFDNTAFGRSQQQLMREVIGYADIEPDGSVKVKVPANIAFGISVLDANGRRITERHQNWLHLRPGEEMECGGCHTSVSELPHGRSDAQAPSVNAGATSDGSPFPNTEPALFANAEETMAEVITRINGVPDPSVDIVFDDLWTDPNVRAKDASFAYNYSDLNTIPPVDAGCVTNWISSCRIVVNYPTHVHPMFAVDRQVFDVDGITLLRDDTCTSCHSPVDAMGVARIPAAQIDLADGPSSDEPDHLTSYRELLFNDNQQEVVNGALIDVLVQAVDANGNLLFEVDANGDLILDANGNPIPVLVPVTTTPPISTAAANISLRFFSIFAPGGTHAGRLTPAELKLISEWNDVGAQYYNNPFDVPP